MTEETEDKKPAKKSKIGRPTTFDQDTADIICVRIGQGQSLRTICKDEGMPAQSTVYLWLQKFPSFSEQYTRAREEQAETLAEEIVDIADETPETTPVFDKEGNVIDIKLDSAYISWQKNRIDARKWTAMKLKPKKYGDRAVLAGDEAAPLQVDLHATVFGELLKNLRMRRQSEE